MKQRNFVDKMAEKTFNSSAIQKSWQIHMAAFGPILENAFVGDYASRIHLGAALNNISRKEIPQALDKLRKIQKECHTDSDKAAWLFFAGLALEMGGDPQQAVSLYRNANEFRHRFYMPYLKVAKLAHSDGMFDIAEENYRAAIDCFQATGLDSQAKTILTSAYCNLATCLIMMRRFEDAENALVLSRQLMPENPARSATEAVLCAVLGQEEEVNKHLSVLESYYPPALEQTAREIRDILEKKHIQFYPVPMEDGAVAGFWNWFTENEAFFREKLAQKDFDSVLEPMTAQLKQLFPFVQREPDFGILIEETHFLVEFADCYAVSLQNGYETLLRHRPAELDENWKFQIIH